MRSTSKNEPPTREDRTASSEGDEPEVYRVARSRRGWGISRRGFIAATAAAIGACSDPEELSSPLSVSSLCRGSGEERPAVTALAFSPDGSLLAVAEAEGHVKIWSVAQGELLQTFRPFSADLTALVIDPDNRYVASAGFDRALVIWSLRDQRIISQVELEGVRRKFLALSPEGTILLSVAAGRPNRARRWSFPGGQPIGPALELGPEADDVAITPDLGGLVSLAQRDHSIKLRSLSDGRLLRALEGHTGRAIALSPDGTLVAVLTPGLTREIEVLTLPEGTSRGAINSNAEEIIFTPDGDRLITGGRSGLIQLWSARDLRPERSLAGHASSVNRLAISDEGTTLASASSDGTVRLWTLPDGLPSRCLVSGPSTTGRVSGHYWHPN